MDKTTTKTVQVDKVAELMNKLNQIEIIREKLSKELRRLIYNSDKKYAR